MPANQVAVIGGTGDEGSGLALRWAKAGWSVVVGSRDAGRAEEAAARLNGIVLGDRITGLANEDAAGAADLVVVTVPFSAQAAIYRSISEHLRPDALVVDCTVPVAANVGGKVTHTLGVWEGSAAQHAQSFLPKGTHMCAAFHSLAAVALNDIEVALDGDVLVCGAKAVKEPVKELVEAIPGLRYVDAGPLENARLVEPLTVLLIGINHRYDTDRAGIHITGI
jgi:NADPH-dependent F420 reductase